ncbi:WGxxGxxG family protein [Paenibacillus sp. MMO-177]|uniref:WGxxGxxG family protein n=1 Tax=Paenibacillus sp. MMO-177 TaxID=3081289 RepID=UPI003017EAD2
MINKTLSGISMALITLLLASPVTADAYSRTANGGNGGLGSGMGIESHGTHDEMSAKSYEPGHSDPLRTNARSNHDVSVYGTGTGSQFRYINANAIGSPNQINTQSGDRYHATAVTTTRKNTGWGWLGLLGLLGLFGIRSRNPERNK